MVCVRCNNNLSGNQLRFCSQHCSKLYLKRLYRKRNREKVNAYNRAYRRYYIKTPVEVVRYKNRPNLQELSYLLEKECVRCNANTKLTLNHIKPLSIGGKTEPKNLETLCLPCNIKVYNELVKEALLFYFEYKKST